MSPEKRLPKAVVDLQSFANQTSISPSGITTGEYCISNPKEIMARHNINTPEGKAALCEHFGVSMQELSKPQYLVEYFSRNVALACQHIQAVQQLPSEHISSHIDAINNGIADIVHYALNTAPSVAYAIRAESGLSEDMLQAWKETQAFLRHDAAHFTRLAHQRRGPEHSSHSDAERHYLSAWQYMIDAFRVFLESHHNTPTFKDPIAKTNVPDMRMDEIFPWMASAMSAVNNYFPSPLLKKGYRITCTPLERANNTIPAHLSGPLFVAVFNAIKNAGRAAMAYFAKQGIHSKNIPTAAQGQGIHIAYGVEDIHGIPHARVKITDSFGGLDATAVMQQMKVFIASEENFLWLMNLPDDVLSLHAKRAVLAWRGFGRQAGNPYAHSKVMGILEELIKVQRISGKDISVSGGVGLAACIQMLRHHMGAIFTGSSASPNGGFSIQFLLPLDTPLLSAAISANPYSLAA